MRFSDLSIQKKLSVILIGAMGLLGATAAAGLFTLWEGMNGIDRSASAGGSQERGILGLAVNFKEQVQEWKNVLVRGKDPEALEKHWGAFQGLSATIQKNGQALADGISDAEARKSVEAFVASHREMQKAYEKGYEAFSKSGFDARAGDAAVKGIDREPARNLQASVELITRSSQAMVDAERSSARRSVAIIAAIAALATALTLLLFHVLMRRQIIAPLELAVKTADDVANGRMEGEIVSGSRDELGRLLAAMAAMKAQLQLYSAAQSEMAAKHEAGLISHRIDATPLPGAYGDLARSTNRLVEGHISVNQQVVDVVSHYSQGDFSRDMPALPGERAVITQAIGGVKASLSTINAEIQALVSAAGRGDFSVRGDASLHQHDFRSMVDGLNRLMGITERGLTDVAKVLQCVAEGDLSQRVKGDLQGKFAELQSDTNKTVDQLSSIIGEIRRSAETMNQACTEIAQGNTNLSSRTEEQASSLEETASSMEELTSTVKQNAENAREANNLAVGASQEADRGGEVVHQVVNTMGGISDSSRRIADIIGVIDGIAFQTNILALNAAVEAARAGEQGRGFAVVATEVRTLAQRSANAAKEIRELIQDSVVRVEAGSKLVEEAGQTMAAVVTSVKRVADIIGEITAASQEQSSGIEQVNQAVTQMDEVTQQNAALVEQSAAAAESMEEQARSLLQAVAVFKLGESAGGPDSVADGVARVHPFNPRRSGAPSTPAEARMVAGGR